MIKIRFKNDWRYSRKGDVIEEGDGVALLLIQRNIAEEVKPEEVTNDEAASADNPSATPEVITRRLPGPNDNRPHGTAGRRGGRG